VDVVQLLYLQGGFAGDRQRFTLAQQENRFSVFEKLSQFYAFLLVAVNGFLNL
jgi:hypothetical protein